MTGGSYNIKQIYNNYIMQQGIIPIVMGGIGNRMFIIAASYVAHKHSSSPLYILDEPDNNKHNKKKYDYNKSVFKYFGEHGKISGVNPYSLGYRIFDSRGFEAWFPEAIQPGTIMTSYFQYYPPLKPFETDLRELFIKGLDEFRNRFTRDYSKCAFLHVRRGDAHENLHIYYLLPVEYYKECVSKLMEKNKVEKIIIFSDEMSWVKEQEYFNSDLFEIYENNDELESLALMTLCTGGAICGGSTFSWWGAFLGAYGQRNPVFVPKNWIKMKIESLFPEEWIIV
jgi:hypothetical protein